MSRHPFDPAAIARVMAAHPEIKTGLIVRTAEEITDAMLQSGIAVFSVKSKAVDETLAARLLGSGQGAPRLDGEQHERNEAHAGI